MKASLEMDEDIKKEWPEFLEWIHKVHQLTADWIPDYYSILLWTEFKKSQKAK